MTNWICSLGAATVVSGCFGDELEVEWLRECWAKSFDELECSDLDGTVDQTRWRRLDFSFSKALQGMTRSSGESFSEDITLKAREFAQRSKILRGRQIYLDDRLLQDELILPRAVHVARHRSTAMAGRREASMVLHTLEIHYYQFVHRHLRRCASRHLLCRIFVPQRSCNQILSSSTE